MGEVKAITAIVEGLGANSDDITWSSSNSNVEIIGQGHTVQLNAISAGSVTIAVTSNQDKSKQGIVQLEILPPIVTQIAVQPEQIELDINNQTKLCSAVEGIGSIDRTIYWSSDSGNC